MGTVSAEKGCPAFVHSRAYLISSSLQVGQAGMDSYPSQAAFYLWALAVAANVAAVAVADVGANLTDMTAVATTFAGDVAAAGSTSAVVL